MDVVKTNIEKLNGVIEIDSELGKGSSFKLKIPLTLAIIQSLLVGTQEEFMQFHLQAFLKQLEYQLMISILSKVKMYYA